MAEKVAYIRITLQQGLVRKHGPINRARIRPSVVTNKPVSKAIRVPICLVRNCPIHRSVDLPRTSIALLMRLSTGHFRTT